MNNTDKLIKKYQEEMLRLSRQSLFKDETAYEEDEQPYVTTDAVEEILPPKVIEEDAPPAAKVLPADTGNHFGTLKVIVFAGNEAYPVQTARVEVFDDEGNELYSLLTDSGGIAEGMVLSTPDKDENDSPGGADGFSVYTIKVTHPDYETEIYDYVQVFEGIESVQPVYLRSELLTREQEGEYER